MNLEYTVTSDRPFETVVADVERLTAEKMFRVLHVHDVQATLAEKGFTREPLKIIEICNAKFAHEALSKDMRVSIFLPCKINVYTEGGKTMIKAMRPLAMKEILPKSGLETVAQEVDRIVVDIVDRAAAGN
ncbi:MAG: DUF302 domain-containing protein [candidate division Zixibacteria bacterium]|nr:DUF302 domain-containing protein [candidate division Zixibacteria bacterium]